MKKIFILTFLFLVLQADTNSTNKDINATNVSSEKNITKDLTKKHLEEEIEREAKYKKEQMFYQGKDYNLSEHQVDKNSLKHIPSIEPDYDFDITDVYRDDI